MAPLLEAVSLTKRFGNVQAVAGISLTVREGECYGLLGPNGAGKTTTVEMMEGILAPDSGEIRYRGKPLGAEYREEIGIQFQSTALQDFLSVREVLELFRSLYRDPAPLDELVARCALGEFLDRYATKVSGGQRQRLLLAVALVNRPRLVFLDEPTTGLDPQARHRFWQLVVDLKRRGTTVVLTTHYMEEASLLCDRIGIVDNGRLIAEGNPGELVRSHFPGMTIRLPRQRDSRLPELPAAVVDTDSHHEIRTDDVAGSLRALLAAGYPLAGLGVHPPTLEDLFLDLTGRALREGA